MPKTKLSDILKNGENFKARKLDPNDPEIKKMFKVCKEEQEKCLERKKIHPSTWNMRINI
jgi:hypothetical protein